MAKYEYPGGVMDWEKPLIDKFETEILPYTIKNGPKIGEAAMQGDRVAEEIIRRQQLFVEGLPELRRANFKMLTIALKLWEKRA